MDPLEAIESQRRSAEQEMDRLVASVARGLDLAPRLLEGEPGHVIVDEAAALPADLIVLGTHGRGRVEHMLLGSVTGAVLRRAPCPVLTVGPRAIGAPLAPIFRSLVCPVDLSLESKGTVEAAVYLTAEDDARITLVHVVDPVDGVVPDPLRPGSIADARAALATLAADACRLGFRISDRVEAGTPWRAILDVAEQEKADVIVMGVHAGGGLRRAIFGSTTSQVVRRADCPVLVVPGGPKPATALHQVAEARLAAAAR
jgi:nucleotide-binding universal stress UspA family protein